MTEVLDFIRQPWAWYVAGPLIALTMYFLLKLNGEFGVSSTLRTWCSVGGAGKFIPFFDMDWRHQLWNILFVLGSVFGGYIGNHLFASPDPLSLSLTTIQDLHALGIDFDGFLLPEQLFSWQHMDLKSFLILIIGGFLVGFGARYAGGCTSGHAISGLSNLQLPSLIAVIGFFIGGLLMTYLLFPLIF